jgi:DNA repair protein RadC
MTQEMKIEQFMVPVYHIELVRDKDITLKSVRGEEAAAAVFHEMLDSSPVEKLAVIYCTNDQRMVGAEIAAIGSVEMVGTLMADLLRGLIKSGLSACYVAHNHVSSSSRASMPDYKFTLAVERACKALDIMMFDHLVIGEGTHYSIYKHREELHKQMLSLDLQTAMAKWSSPKKV